MNEQLEIHQRTSALIVLDLQRVIVERSAGPPDRCGEGGPPLAELGPRRARPARQEGLRAGVHGGDLG
jgi:hypothetical protein